ncbi:MAG: hypothetical protein AB8G05_05775 [Oligoflexales bacterium]
MPESNTSQTTQSSSPKSSPTCTIPIRISKPTSRVLRAIVNKCNKKSLGRKVKADDVIEKSLILLTNQEIEEIKNKTLSSKDKLEIELKMYSRKNGCISKDDFLQLILSKAIPHLSQAQGINSKKETTSS